ncbi:MAG: ABC transporter substrate-binding protein [Lachnospiraceae bacterium]|nr:ABC transporter substrate-binding protein [Lachnospiraceae bacterium]
MKKMKKVVCFGLISAMMLSAFAGCGKKSDSGAIRIGGTGPLTGGAAVYGMAAKRGAEIAVEEINALGGMQFELRYEDDTHDAEKAVNAYNILKDWNVQISLGSVTSQPCVATAAETYADRIFALTPSASATDVTKGKDNMFQMCFSDPNQGSASAQYISEKKLGTKVAIIYKNDDVYSTGIFETFMDKADELGINVVSKTTFNTDSQNDFSVQLGEAQKAGADLVFLPMYYEAAALILDQAKKMNYAPKFFGVDGMDGILTLEGFDTSLAEGVMLLTPFSADATDEKTVNFVKKYNEKFGETPNQFAADAYDCVYAIYEACQKGKVTSDMTAEEVCDIMIEQFTTLKFDGLTGAGMTWGKNGEVTKSPKGMVIENGVYVGLD